ncbi:MAG: LptA/OstA family protein [Pseudomonadota bacterium]|nr:hypothetical protein [Gammaproteobacteria bacterium]MBU1558949.1 hypothetical protein [Gammaproteobacteria bacterium]MBU1926511.1 hypothetical protein [Gammaproteobacteria bacterium]MBU2545681.1 hypothetical protein [Gammaproteobacteria bacterium]
MQFHLIKRLLPLSLFICTSAVAANTLFIHADSIQINYKQGKTRYTGHVRITDQHSQLTGNQVTTHENTQKKIDRVIAQGNPANYIDHSDKNQPPLQAIADTIHYFPLKHLTQLRNPAKAKPAQIKQGKSILRGSTILIQKNAANQLESITAYGTPATYHTSSIQPAFDGKASVIKYFPKKHLITFHKHAFTKRGKTFLEGEKIQFNTKKNVLRAISDPQEKVHLAIDNPDFSK